MTGCLTFPLRVLASLLLIAGLVLGWAFRDELVRIGRRELGLPDLPSRVGVPSSGGLTGARSRIDSLVRGTSDSVVLNPGEVASLVDEVLRRASGGGPDSVSVELGERTLAIRARVPTAPIPASIRDLLGSALGERETVELVGLLAVRRIGEAEFEVERVRVKGFPVPRDLVGRLVGRYLPDVDGPRAVVPLPAGVTGVRITPGGAILFGRGTR